jgi:hypothetical protein
LDEEVNDREKIKFRKQKCGKIITAEMLKNYLTRFVSISCPH